MAHLFQANELEICVKLVSNACRQNKAQIDKFATLRNGTLAKLGEGASIEAPIFQLLGGQIWLPSEPM